jgi:hypothetical protein
MPFSCSHIYKEDTVHDLSATPAYNPNEIHDYQQQYKKNLVKATKIKTDSIAFDKILPTRNIL